MNPKAVENVLARLRPRLQMDGGDVELVAVTADGVVQVRLTGACHGCPMSAMTLKMALELEIKREIPEVQEVQAIE
ncbi:MAG: NifU family protein [Elusimicrobia bacterium]|nr:NifU family protein [Elusimicrobiota bacterium]